MIKSIVLAWWRWRAYVLRVAIAQAHAQREAALARAGALNGYLAGAQRRLQKANAQVDMLQAPPQVTATAARAV